MKTLNNKSVICYSLLMQQHMVLNLHTNIKVHSSVSDWLMLNGTSKQKSQFLTTAGEVNQLRRLRMANEKRCIILYVTQLQCNTFYHKTLHYTNATTGYLIVWHTCIIITLAPSPTQAWFHTPYSISFHAIWMQFNVIPNICAISHVFSVLEMTFHVLMNYWPVWQFPLVHEAKCAFVALCQLTISTVQWHPAITTSTTIALIVIPYDGEVSRPISSNCARFGMYCSLLWTSFSICKLSLDTLLSLVFLFLL